METSTSAIATQTEKLIERKRVSPQSARIGGTRDSWAIPSRYQIAAPITMVPTASVTTRGLSLKFETSTPLTAPTPAETASATTTAWPSAASSPPETPRIRLLESVMTAGIERSMPRAMRTRASPIDARQRKAAKGMMARIEVAIRLRGTKIALMTMSRISASQIARNRGWGCNASRMPGTDIFISRVELV